MGCHIDLVNRQVGIEVRSRKDNRLAVGRPGWIDFSLLVARESKEAGAIG